MITIPIRNVTYLDRRRTKMDFARDILRELTDAQAEQLMKEEFRRRLRKPRLEVAK